MGRLKKLAISTVMAVMVLLVMATPALAIALPDSTPTIINKHIFRNILETGDWVIIFEENTPYAATPAISYPNAFIWRLIDTDGTTELAQALGYTTNEDGYGYNVISFYLSAAEVTALGITWGDALFLRLSGTPTAFASPPIYNYEITADDYSSLTATADVQVAIASLILELASDLNVAWGLTSSTSLLSDSEVGTVLSIDGQAFFRGAIYGVQAMAPLAFPMTISNVDVTTRTWSTSYSDNLAGQNAGNYLGTGIAAGNTFLDSSYNLFGLILVIGICLVIIFGHWYLAGGNVMRGLTESVPALIIGTRMGLMGMGELGLVAAICVLYGLAKLWRMI